MTYQYFRKVPNVTQKYLEGDTSNNTLKYWECGLPPDNSLHLFRSHDDGNLPWIGIVFGLTVSAVWYWCSDQVNKRPVNMGWIM